MTQNTIQEWFDARAPLLRAFLMRSGLPSGVDLVPIGQDCAFRRYFRVQKPDGSTVISMEAVPDSSEMATPGHKLSDFIYIGKALSACGLTVPEIYEVDEENGYLLLQDFGDSAFKNVLLDERVPAERLYKTAIDVLLYIANQSQHIVQDMALGLPDYYDSHVHQGRRRLVDWYVPVLRQGRNKDGLVKSYLEAWDEVEAALPACPQGFLHIDFHFENLMWLGGKGVSACGILDFQGGMRGPVPYDLANLLEDARVDVPAELRDRMLDRFVSGMSEDEARVFRSWYRVLATQFHCRVSGQFIRLAIKDNKPRYLAYLPRVMGYLNEGLRDPVLAPVKA